MWSDAIVSMQTQKPLQLRCRPRHLPRRSHWLAVQSCCQPQQPQCNLRKWWMDEAHD
jgi:hypothetical protein